MYWHTCFFFIITDFDVWFVVGDGSVCLHLLILYHGYFRSFIIFIIIIVVVVVVVVVVGFICMLSLCSNANVVRGH